ncbi:MAG: hypothetical protein AAGF81_11270 [Pseudomonadota bacterium]
MATRHRQRLNLVLEQTGSAEAPSAPPVREVPKQRPGKQARPPSRPRKRRSAPRQNFDRIALWSTVAPSTIAAVFAGVAMSGNNVPLAYALGFVFTWFVLTTGLAIGAVKLFSTRECVSLLKSSSPRLGAAAISCALVAVLAVQLAHLSITAIASEPPPQVSGNAEPAVTPVRSAKSTTVQSRSQTLKKRASVGSVHYRSTPNLIDPNTQTSALSASVEERVVALPAPADQDPLGTSKVSVPKTPISRANDELLGRISSKGKYVVRQPVSRKRRLTEKQKTPAPASRSFFGKFIDPVINSASAKTDAGRVGSDINDQEQISR